MYSHHFLMGTRYRIFDGPGFSPALELSNYLSSITVLPDIQPTSKVTYPLHFSQCCSRLRHKVIRKELYSHDDEDMYWPGQLFHKDESGKYRNSDWRAKFWRKIESARLFVVE